MQNGKLGDRGLSHQDSAAGEGDRIALLGLGLFHNQTGISRAVQTQANYFGDKAIVIAGQRKAIQQHHQLNESVLVAQGVLAPLHDLIVEYSRFFKMSREPHYADWDAALLHAVE